MTRTREQAEDTIEQIVLKIARTVCDQSDAVRIGRERIEWGTVLTLHVADEDYGHMIGKSGVMIRSMQTLCRLIGANHKTDVSLQLPRRPPRVGGIGAPFEVDLHFNIEPWRSFAEAIAEAMFFYPVTVTAEQRAVSVITIQYDSRDAVGRNKWVIKECLGTIFHAVAKASGHEEILVTLQSEVATERQCVDDVLLAYERGKRL